MGATVDASLIVTTVTTQTGVGFNDEAKSARDVAEHRLKLASGVGVNQQDIEYSTKRVAVNGDTDIDLSALVHEETGQAIVFVKITGFMVVYHSITPGEVLTIGAAAVNPWAAWLAGTAPAVTYGPGGVHYLANPVDGWAVGNDASDILRISTSASSDWSLKIWGRTA